MRVTTTTTVGACPICRRAFFYDPINPANVIMLERGTGMFPRIGTDPARVQRLPLCDSCVSVLATCQSILLSEDRVFLERRPPVTE